MIDRLLEIENPNKPWTMYSYTSHLTNDMVDIAFFFSQDVLSDER